MTRRLIILACSDRKDTAKEPIPAIERYDGPLWQTLRTHAPHASSDGELAVGFLSAAYGFGDALNCRIPNYNSRLTAVLAEQMISGGLAKSWDPAPKRKRNTGLERPSSHYEIASMTRYGREPFDEVCLVGGETYLRVMRAFVFEMVQIGFIKADAKVVEINGSIGVMRQELRTFIVGSDNPLPTPAPVSPAAMITIAAAAPKRGGASSASVFAPKKPKPAVGADQAQLELF